MSIASSLLQYAASDSGNETLVARHLPKNHHNGVSEYSNEVPDTTLLILVYQHKGD
jgi:hypothetical protein